MDDQQFRQLLDYFGFSWKGYRKVRKGVKKRVQRHMGRISCRNMADYLAELDRNPRARHECTMLMTVSISRFFRDRKFWYTLEKRLLPELIEGSAEKLKVWSAGCACGDEVYSFKIIWDCLKKRRVNLPKLEFLATDIHPVYLDRAQKGVYSGSSLKELKEELQIQYFRPEAGKQLYRLKVPFSREIVWQRHDLLSTPPGYDFQIIFLRNNILTYYDEPLKQRVFKNVLQSLALKGLLIIGSHESLPPGTRGLACVDPHPFVYRKNA